MLLLLSGKSNTTDGLRAASCVVEASRHRAMQCFLKGVDWMNHCM